MAELRNGPLGSISGKVGNMVASNWRDISYLRGLGKKSKKEATDSQKEVQMKLQLMQAFLSGIKATLERGLSNKNAKRATLMNVAMALNAQAFTGLYPELKIDYSKIVISTGRYKPLYDVKVEISGTGDMQLTWGDFGAVEGITPDDKISVVVYCPSLDLHAVYRDIAVRSALSVDVVIPESFKGVEIHFWFFVKDPTGSRNSPSTYLSVNP